jgi:acyl-lipid omega-6 desaturase (Delta-12 desaturase)
VTTANIDRKVSKEDLKEFINSDWRKSTWQIINSVVPYFAMMAGMYWSLQYSYLLTLLLAVPAAGFMVRIFIIFHDCGHGSFFNSTRVNNTIGSIAGLFLFVPYHQWRHDHAKHHATCSDLDRRGVGDVWTLTVSEYKALPKGKRFLYRLYRNPVVLFVLGPIYMIFINNRLATSGSKKRERRSVYLTNLGLVIILALMSMTIGLKSYLLIQIPVIMIAWMAGIWLFYVQHQFEDTYWEKHENWDYFDAAIQGSSFYKLPVLLQWFSGNIGFHHVHHFNARIPNYNLQNCHEQIQEFKNIKPVTLLSSLKLMNLSLWDEKNRRLIGFSGIDKIAIQPNS